MHRTARAWFDRTSEQRRRHRADLLALLRRAPKAVRIEYIRCKRRIRELLDCRAEPDARVEAVLSPPPDPPFNTRDLHWIFHFLSHRANGWNISLVGDASDPAGYEIRFAFDSRED